MHSVPLQRFHLKEEEMINQSKINKKNMNEISTNLPGTTPFVAMALIDIAVSNVCVDQ